MKKSIIIVLISGISGVLIALIGNGLINKSNCKEAPKYNLKITDIKLERNIDIEGIRIIGRINGFDFSYPSSSFVVEPKFFIPNQKFEIENKNGFDCFFEVVVLDKYCQFYYLRPLNSFIINQSDFDYSGVYKMNLQRNIINSANDSVSLNCMIEFKIY